MFVGKILHDARHSDGADHHRYEHEQDQPVIGNRPDVTRPDRRR